MSDEFPKLDPYKIYEAIRQGTYEAITQSLRDYSGNYALNGKVIADAIKEGAKQAFKAE